MFRVLTILILLGIVIANMWGRVGLGSDQLPYSSGPTAPPSMEAPSYPPPNSN